MGKRGFLMNGDHVIEQAKEIAKELNITDLKFSNGWIRNFKRRHNLKFKKAHGEKHGGPMLGGLSAGAAGQSPSKRPRSPGVVAQSPAKRLKQQGQIKHFFKPFSCAQCDYKSTTSASLRQHESIHIKERTFSCTHCDFKSTTSASLRQHESIHIKEKTFSCTRCDYKSTTSASLKEHEAIHNPITSFPGWTDS